MNLKNIKKTIEIWCKNVRSYFLPISDDNNNFTVNNNNFTGIYL